MQSMERQRYIAVLLASLTILTACTGNPLTISTNEEDKFDIKNLLKDQDNMATIEKVLTEALGMLEESFYKLFNKVNSLSLLTDNIVKQSKDMTISFGLQGDMTNRCPKGFRAVAGDRYCYYLSTYKQPWSLAREHCMQLGPDVDMLNIWTTKRQFIVTHLIQSDPDARHVKQWWTSGVGQGGSWIWSSRMEQRPLFFSYFEDDKDKKKSDVDNCIVLDSESYYQWKVKKCTSRSTVKSVETEHHFICQQQALEPVNSDIQKISNDIIVQNDEAKAMNKTKNIGTLPG